MAETILTALLKLNLAGGAAILLVLALRPMAGRALGVRAAYRLWLIVPVAALAVLIPAREAIPAAPELPVWAFEEPPPAGTPAIPPEFGFSGGAPTPIQIAPPPAEPMPAAVLAVVWLLGAGAMLARAVVATRCAIAGPEAGPALVGVLRPRLILPADFEARFDARERSLILAHEDTHRAGGHAALNAAIELARCACWFNPLAHVAVRHARADQELACDAAVMAAHPDARGVYARAMLKSQVAARAMPLGCAWPGRSARRLKERIAMLDRRPPGRRRVAAGALAVAAISAGAGVAAWAAQPARIARPEAVWTPSAEAPEGVLTELEAQRHDLFIDLARNASPCTGPRECAHGTGIDVVFFGTTNTEMFWWPDRGMPVWEEFFGSRRAANFGSQGTDPESLLWRMRNGELDGYQAKVVVLSAFCCIDAVISDSQREELIPAYAPIIAEIKARQPGAKILIFAVFPRGAMRLEEWRRAAEINAAAHAPLIDNETVFWIDIGERFYRPDGSHDQSMWSLDMRSRGIQAPAFEAWVEELEPWLERFVD